MTYISLVEWALGGCTIEDALLLQRLWLCAVIEQHRLNQALASAIRSNDVDAVRLCLKDGADPDARVILRGNVPALTLTVTDFYDDNTPYYDQDGRLVSEGTHYSIPMPGNSEIMQELLDWGADINARDAGGETALMHAVRLRQKHCVTFLVEHRANVNVANNWNMTALWYCVHNDYKMTQLLLDTGANVNVQDVWGRTPLLISVEVNSSEPDRLKIIEELLLRGADANLRDNEGRKPLDRIGDPGFAPLQWWKLKRLLTKAGAKIS